MAGHAPFFFVDPSLLDARGGTGGGTAELVLSGDDARHLAVVRRAAVGDVISVSDGRGRVAHARLTALTPRSVRAELEEIRRVAAPSPPVVLCMGLARTVRVDEALRHLVELGVDKVVIFEAGRSVARWDEQRRRAAVARWAAIARAAAKQSHRAWLPEVLGPLGAAEAAVRAGGGGRGVIAVPGAEARLDDALAAPPGAPVWAPVWAVVGPEGGLAPDEVAAFTAAGATPIGLGDQILRAETASVVVATLVLHHVGRLA